jgi:hypothetical protein
VGAGQEALSPGPFYGQGSFGASFGHSARASSDGMEAFVSYWDLGVVTLDISDVTNPTLVSRTTFAADADGDAHSLVPYSAGGTDFILQNDEDFDPRSPGRVIVAGDRAGIFNEAPYAPPIFFERRHRINAKTVRPRHEGCSKYDYRGLRVDGRIAVVKTLDPLACEAACNEIRLARIAQRKGAAAVLHDFKSNVTSPQFFDFGSGIHIPVAFADHPTARDVLDVGRATLRARRGSWGFLRGLRCRHWRAGRELRRPPYVHDIAGPTGAWSIHNTEVAGDHAYSSWYSHGVVALDLTLGQRHAWRSGDGGTVRSGTRDVLPLRVHPAGRRVGLGRVHRSFEWPRVRVRHAHGAMDRGPDGGRRTLTERISRAALRRTADRLRGGSNLRAVLVGMLREADRGTGRTRSWRRTARVSQVLRCGSAAAVETESG